jgi:glutathionyl-hydroquinone reductase
MKEWVLRRALSLTGLISPKIILYTNRLCPWAHRAHIALKEIGLDYEEVTIRPRC